MIKKFFVLIILSFLLLYPFVSAGWWNFSYDYRQEINLTNTGGEQTDYQVSILLNGSVVGANFNWSNGGSDIRFTNSSDDLLDIFIPVSEWDVTTNKSEVWVEVPTILNNSNTQLFMYYGNPIVSTYSNGTDTFRLYSDHNISGDSINYYPNSSMNFSTTSNQFVAYSEMSLTGKNTHFLSCTQIADSTPYAYPIFTFSRQDENAGIYYATGYHTNSYNGSKDKYRVYENASGMVGVSLWDVSVDTGYSDPCYVYMRIDTGDSSWGASEICVAKYVSPEPGYTLGSEGGVPGISGAPVVTLNSPVNNNWTNNDNPGFNWSVVDSDDAIINNCTLFHVVGASSHTGTVFNVTNNTANVENLGVLNEGVGSWFVNCSDDTNTTKSSVRILNIDSTNPVVVINSPDNNSISSNLTQIFNYTPTDNLAINTSCSLFIGGVINSTNSTALNDTSSIFIVVFGDGIYSWSVNCTDIAGNSGFSGDRSVRVLSGDTINISDDVNPVSGSLINTLPVIFNTTVNLTLGVNNCSLILDGSVNQTVFNVSNVTNTLLNFSLVNLSDANHTWLFNCMDVLNSENSSVFWFLFDFEPPVISDDFLNNSLWYETSNMTAQINFSDNLLIHRINITIDDTIVLVGEEHYHNQTFNYSLNYNVTNLSVGFHTLFLEVADGHTSTVLKDGDDYNPSNGLFNDYIKYSFKGVYDKMYIDTRLKSSSLFDDWSSTMKVDRFTETFIPSKPNVSQTFIVTSDVPIYIASVPGKYGDHWLIIGDHWKDFVLLDEPGSKVSMNRVSDYEVEVTISGITKSPSKLVFDSVGDLNIVNKTYNFYRVNMTETFSNPVFSGFSTVINLSVDFGGLLFVLDDLSPVAVIDFNGVNFSTTLVDWHDFNASFTVNVSIPGVNFSDSLVHKWYFNLSNTVTSFNHTLIPLFTRDESQVAYNVTVGPCFGVVNHTIVNFSYFDESTLSRINSTNTYDLIIFDGTFYYNQTNSTFIRNESNQLCTNLDPAVIVYNWDLWGSFILSEPTYITRVIDIEEAVPISVSNSPVTNTSFFLIKVANSSTVKFNWLTQSFQLIDGTMRIFRCEDNGTKNMVASTNVISGVTNANLELLTAAYSYDIIIDGLIFSDPDGYSKCHVESETEITYFVDTGLTDVTPLIGLHGIQCLLNRSGVDVVSMSWSANLEDDSFVKGCLGAYVSNIYGGSLVQENCSELVDGFFFEVNFSSLGLNDYVVIGDLRQGGLSSVCDNNVPFSTSTPAQETAGITFLIAAFFIVASVILIFAGDGEVQLVGAIVGLVGVTVLGLLKFPISVVLSLIIFLILILVIGRATRRKT